MWFATGIVMMYAGGMPRLTPQLRLERLPELDLSRVRLTPAEAAERAGLLEALRARRRCSRSWTGRRTALRRRTTTVFADTGEVLDDRQPGAVEDDRQPVHEPARRPDAVTTAR